MPLRTAQYDITDINDNVTPYYLNLYLTDGHVAHAKISDYEVEKLHQHETGPADGMTYEEAQKLRRAIIADYSDEPGAAHNFDEVDIVKVGELWHVVADTSQTWQPYRFTCHQDYFRFCYGRKLMLQFELKP